MSSTAYAQHNDIEFGYDNTVSPAGFVLSPLGFNTTTAEGIVLVKSNMEELDPFTTGDFAADQPGFTNNLAEGLLVNPDDSIWFNALDASVHSSFGVGYVNYFNPLTNSLEASGRLQIEDNAGSNTANLVLDGGLIESGTNPQFIGLANSNGYVHDHITWDLLDDATAPLGAYGILGQLQSDYAPLGGGTDLSSDRFWIVFNHGMSSTDFENLALPQYGVGAVPEPGSSVLIGLTVCFFVTRRRRMEGLSRAK
ncbi:PEP-CTERM sorting domain-containing protein [Mariniblastus fucicola]|uniref:PEP-CTERM sorting domain-containing protein n=1 Tax=Mariniblastus fucicola TaxID=980251 RepID=UPI000946259C|nr:PEP-CTERM sorting domain-containing protein [Mariniblastus fucicola]